MCVSSEVISASTHGFGEIEKYIHHSKATCERVRKYAVLFSFERKQVTTERKVYEKYMKYCAECNILPPARFVNITVFPMIVRISVFSNDDSARQYRTLENYICSSVFLSFLPALFPSLSPTLLPIALSISDCD